MKNRRQCVERGVILFGIIILVLLIAHLWYLNYREQVSVSINRAAAGAADETARNKNKETEDVKPKLALTFDDGPHPVFTPKLLDGLKERGVKATFFVVGENIIGNEDIIKRMSDEGHIIGNHTYTHVDVNTMSMQKACGEFAKASELVRKITGNTTDYVRPPFGKWNKKLEGCVTMIPVMWNIDPLDWCTDNTSQVVNKVVTKAKENAIILLHDYYQSSVDAALQIVDQLQARGYQFVTVEEILLE